MFERYPEKTFYRILAVETLDTPKCDDELKKDFDYLRKVKVTCEKVFRGKRFEKPTIIEAASYKTDFRLLSKKEEKDYCQVIGTHSSEEKLLSPEMDLPPLLKELLIKEGKTNLKMKTVIQKDILNKKHRIAKEGETPNVEVTINIGKPVSPNLYKGLNL